MTLAEHPLRISVLLVLVALGMSGCSSFERVAPLAEAPPVQETVPVAGLPEVPPTAPPQPPPTLPATTTTLAPRLTGVDVPIGRRASGPELLVIGDGVLAQTAARNTGEACTQLTKLGWNPEVAAEPGRYMAFAEKVVKERRAAGADWDAVVILLGNQYDGGAEELARDLTSVLALLGERPVIVLNTASRGAKVAEVNQTIAGVVADAGNAALVDWRDVAINEPVAYLKDRGPMLTPKGVHRLVELIGESLGRAPEGDEDSAVCRDEQYTDDSAIVL